MAAFGCVLGFVVDGSNIEAGSWVMPMNEVELTEAVLEMRDAIHSLTAGCGELAGAIANQTRLLVAIQEAVTAEPQDESPIVALLKRLVELSEANAAALSRLEQTRTR
jgi:ABC-type antimicrobial peptide transport system ATPase subunit